MNVSGPDIRVRRITGHRKTTLNRLKMTHNQCRAVRLGRIRRQIGFTWAARGPLNFINQLTAIH
jgi:hypothetical protein